jgi:hypothetical protein
MPDTLYDRMVFSGLDEAIDRLRAFAKAHNDFEPSLVCERDRGGRRRWALTVIRRNQAEQAKHRKIGANGG